jgi:hypothetical protein
MGCDDFGCMRAAVSNPAGNAISGDLRSKPPSVPNVFHGSRGICDVFNISAGKPRFAERLIHVLVHVLKELMILRLVEQPWLYARVGNQCRLTTELSGRPRCRLTHAEPTNHRLATRVRPTIVHGPLHRFVRCHFLLRALSTRYTVFPQIVRDEDTVATYPTCTEVPLGTSARILTESWIRTTASSYAPSPQSSTTSTATMTP